MKNLSFITTAALITVIMLLIYVTVQQSYRTGLNDPQLQIAKDISLQLEDDKTIDASMNTDPIDITKSLAPFIVLYDAQGKPLRSNAFLDGKMPQVPLGVFEEVKVNAEYDVSWQPRKSVRMAMVIVKTNAATVQYVAVGRSMTIVEERISNLLKTVFIAWIICLTIIAISAAVGHFKNSK